MRSRLQLVGIGGTGPLILLALLCSGCGREAETGGSTTVKPTPADAAIGAKSKTPTAAPVFELSTEGDFTVRGLRGETEAQRLTVYVGGEVGHGQRPIAGTYASAGETKRFTPEFGLDPGQTYTAVLVDEAGAMKHRHTFTVPAPTTAADTRVTAVYPSRTELPQNLLKFYLHFSAPMRAGDAYRHIHLLDADGQPIEDPFLELGEELWDPSATRLTLLFDPGRIKQGLKPREDVGPPLLLGRHYTLMIDADWRDADGEPLAAEFRKEFDVVDPDRQQPVVERWRITAPVAGTTDPLEVVFEESLDSAMLQHLSIAAPGTETAIEGRIELAKAETVWRFHPQSAWGAGRYQLIVPTTLEDVAGNSLARPFEVDLDSESPPQPVADTVSIPFEITTATTGNAQPSAPQQ